MGGHDIVGGAANPGALQPAFLEIDTGSPGTAGGAVTIQGGDGAAGEGGGDAELLGGGGDAQSASFSIIRARGGGALGSGGNVELLGGPAVSGHLGGGVFLTPGTDGAGRTNGIVLDINTLPTVNPGNPGQLYFNASTNALLVSQG
jgi:hypothetical protein